MNKKIFGIIGLLAVVASLAMYIVGNKSSHLSEFQDYWWIPLPLALICFLAASKKPTNK